eukprot:3070513-Prymnesium_polylepis.1
MPRPGRCGTFGCTLADKHAGLHQLRSRQQVVRLQPHRTRQNPMRTRTTRTTRTMLRSTSVRRTRRKVRTAWMNQPPATSYKGKKQAHCVREPRHRGAATCRRPPDNELTADVARLQAQTEGLTLVPSANASGFKYVLRFGSYSFQLAVWDHNSGRRRHLGTFKTAEAAYASHRRRGVCGGSSSRGAHGR